MARTNNNHNDKNAIVAKWNSCQSTQKYTNEVISWILELPSIFDVELFTCSTFRLGMCRKDSISLTFTWGCRVWKQAWMLCSLFWLSWEHIVLPDHKSSVDPNLLWSHSAVSPEAILKRNFDSVLRGIRLDDSLRWRISKRFY